MQKVEVRCGSAADILPINVIIYPTFAVVVGTCLVWVRLAVITEAY
jgi:hypothetical protein